MPAQRSPDKRVRVSTHQPVLRACFQEMIDRQHFDPTGEESPLGHADNWLPNIHVLEHGMGIASTPFFHSLPYVMRILSFEDDPNWATCENCSAWRPLANHRIVKFPDSELDQLIASHVIVQRSLTLVDGPHLQRIKVIRSSLRNLSPFIVEHDSESLPPDELEERLELCKQHGYRAWKYEVLNPETMCLVRDDIDADMSKHGLVKL